ncbi:mycofactocin biosynthesis glycosyltransferase MftF, partial [Klenkia sp. PcliD-1-E]|uniref:mycofactocin biosynthesis glycosyltransferase MftF n=1 Tax=Klenkia sp. PcliD-1-E TaxID=2954492 RepID=UPI00209706A4
MTPPPDRLPDGFRVVLDPRTRRRDGGAALLGGSPLRLLRLAPRARALLTGDTLDVADATTAALAARLLDAGLAHPDLPAVDPADVTVVVPVKDRAAELDRLLRALRADLPDVPLLVVDDGSADPAATAAVCAAHGAEVLRHATARGPAAARNAGLAAATTTAVAFVDSDCVPVPGWLGVLTAHLADPRLAVVAPRIVALPADRPGWVGAYEDAVSALDMGPRPAPVAALTGVSYVPSAALLVRRSALGRGFDEDLQVAEDVDLVWRLAAAGWRVRYDPAARVAHEHPARTAAWLRRRAYYGTGAALLAQRHGSAVAPVVMSPWSAAAWGLALLGGRPGLLGAAAVLAGATAKL